MPVKELLKNRVKDAMRNKNAIERDLLRMVIATVDNLEMSQGKSLTDDQIYKAMTGIVADNNKTLHGFTDKEGKFNPGIDQRIVNAAGEDLVACQTQQAKLNQENSILESMIPKTLTIDEVRAALAPLAESIKAEANVGKASGIAFGFFKKNGQLVDSNEVKDVVAEIRA